jgi:hypothetical protein
VLIAGRLASTWTELNRLGYSRSGLRGARQRRVGWVGWKRLEITLGRCKRPPQVLCSHGVWCTSLLGLAGRLAGTGTYLPTDLTLSSRVDMLTPAALLLTNTCVYGMQYTHSPRGMYTHLLPYSMLRHTLLPSLPRICLCFLRRPPACPLLQSAGCHKVTRSPPTHPKWSR